MAQLALGTSAASTRTTASGHIAVIDGQPTTTTQDIADVYGKRHDDVLRIVRQRVAEAGEWGVRNFTDTPYTNPQNGQTYTVIRMTKKGFHFVVGKFTGAKAVAHQIAFADEFERMESELAGRPQTALAAHTTEQIYRKASMASLLGNQVQAAAFNALLKQQPLPGEHKHFSVQPLVHEHAGRIAAEAVPHVITWMMRLIERRVKFVGDDNDIYARVDQQLRNLSFYDWLTDERGHAAQSLLVFFETARDLATKGEAAMQAQLAELDRTRQPSAQALEGGAA